MINYTATARIAFMRLKIFSLIALLLLPKAFAESVSSTMVRLQMMQILTGAPVEVQAHRLPQFLEENFKYRIQCDEAFFAGLTKLECLIGQRTLASALIAGLLPRPQERVVIEIGVRWRIMNTHARVASVTVPFSAPERLISNFVSREISTPAYARRFDLLNLIENQRLELEE